MKVLGIAIQKGTLFFSVLEGTRKADSQIIHTGKAHFRTECSIPELMNIFESDFIELITKYKPDRIAYKLSLEPDMEQMTYLQFPFGILNLLCYKKNINITQRSIKWITGGKKKKLLECIEYFIDKNGELKGLELESVLVAWNELEK